jgi:hypothetical protein
VLLVIFAFAYGSPLFGSEPNPPKWPSNVYVFDPATPQTTQQIVDQAFAVNGGNNPPFNGQWSYLRYAFLFLPGTHNVTVNVGYYTSVIGLGESPYDTNIQTVVCQNGDFDYSGGALSNFWRSAENFYTKPITTYNNSPTPAMLWAVSQACPLRRVVIDGDLDLYQYNSGCCAGYSSGGFLADSTITGTVYSGSQQQWLTRNTQMGVWNGGNWNMVFVGSTGSLPATHCSNSGGWPITTISSTPVIAEKPYIMINSDGTYSLVVPNLEYGKVGPTTDFTNAQIIDFSNVYVAVATDSADTINSKLASGLHLVLTPGNYNLTSSIMVTLPNTVVVGIGFPTLIAVNGQPAVIVTATEGARISGILLQAGPMNTTNLLQWGSNDNGNAANPGFLYDCFARVGGTNDPSVQQMTADTMVEISQGNLVVDNTWLWRADHDITGQVYNSDNPNYHGLQVNADNVIVYGLASEHQLEDLVQWNGEAGQVFFYQSELPYDVTQSNFGDPGYVSFRVSSSVDQFKGYGMGVYSYFRDYSVTVANGMTSPVTGGIQFVNSLTVFLNGNGQITAVVNGEGTPVNQPAETSYVCNN